jgi:hypothetical protein
MEDSLKTCREQLKDVQKELENKKKRNLDLLNRSYECNSRTLRAALLAIHMESKSLPVNFSLLDLTSELPDQSKLEYQFRDRIVQEMADGCPSSKFAWYFDYCLKHFANVQKEERHRVYNLFGRLQKIKNATVEDAKRLLGDQIPFLDPDLALRFVSKKDEYLKNPKDDLEPDDLDLLNMIFEELEVHCQIGKEPKVGQILARMYIWVFA